MQNLNKYVLHGQRTRDRIFGHVIRELVRAEPLSRKRTMPTRAHARPRAKLLGWGGGHQRPAAGVRVRMIRGLMDRVRHMQRAPCVCGRSAGPRPRTLRSRSRSRITLRRAAWAGGGHRTQGRGSREKRGTPCVQGAVGRRQVRSCLHSVVDMRRRAVCAHIQRGKHARGTQTQLCTHELGVRHSPSVVHL